MKFLNVHKFYLDKITALLHQHMVCVGTVEERKCIYKHVIKLLNSDAHSKLKQNVENYSSKYKKSGIMFASQNREEHRR